MYSREFVLEIVKKNGLELKNFVDFQDDKDVVIKSIEQNALALQFASYRLKNYKNIVTLAVKNNFRALEFASDRLKNYKTLVIIAVKNNGYALEFVSDRLRNNKEVVLEAVKNNPKAFKFVGDKIKEQYFNADYFLSFNKIKNNYNNLKDENIRYLKTLELIFEEIESYGENIERRCSLDNNTSWLETKKIYIAYYTEGNMENIDLWDCISKLTNRLSKALREI